MPSEAEISLTPSLVLLLLPFHLMFPSPNSHAFVHPSPFLPPHQQWANPRLAARSHSAGSGHSCYILAGIMQCMKLQMITCQSTLPPARDVRESLSCWAETAGVTMCQPGLDSLSRQVNNNESYWWVWTETMRFLADVDVIFSSPWKTSLAVRSSRLWEKVDGEVLIRDENPALLFAVDRRPNRAQFIGIKNLITFQLGQNEM